MFTKLFSSVAPLAFPVVSDFFNGKEANNINLRPSHMVLPDRLLPLGRYFGNDSGSVPPRCCASVLRYRPVASSLLSSSATPPYRPRSPKSSRHTPTTNSVSLFKSTRVSVLALKTITCSANSNFREFLQPLVVSLKSRSHSILTLMVF
jgi:hypothetical protein